jgi:Tfp pilus assembly protein PilV
VIVSLLLLSIILIGFNVLCIHSLKGQRNTFYFTQAVNQISSMKERLRALGDKFGLDKQVSAWNLENSIVLPKGIGSVTGVYPEYTLNINWGKTQSECENITIGESGCIKENFTA